MAVKTPKSWLHSSNIAGIVGDKGCGRSVNANSSRLANSPRSRVAALVTTPDGSRILIRHHVLSFEEMVRQEQRKAMVTMSFTRLVSLHGDLAVSKNSAVGTLSDCSDAVRHRREQQHRAGSGTRGGRAARLTVIPAAHAATCHVCRYAVAHASISVWSLPNSPATALCPYVRPSLLTRGAIMLEIRHV